MGARPAPKHERERLVEIIAPKDQIQNFFLEKHFDFLTSVSQQRLQEMILSSRVEVRSGTTPDYGERGPAQNSAIPKSNTANPGGRIALLPFGGEGYLWASGPFLHC